MKKPSRRTAEVAVSDDLRPVYHIDYSTAAPNRFAARLGPETGTVVLEADVAKVFDTSKAVNEVLRTVIAAVPAREPKSRARRKAG